jgi:uncharacterized protein YndB with AHSA1/START domain
MVERSFRAARLPFVPYIRGRQADPEDGQRRTPSWADVCPYHRHQQERPMLRVQAPDVVIQRPPAEVFAKYADGQGYPTWMPGVRDVAMLTPAPVGLHSRFQGTFPGAGRVQWDTLEFDPPRRMVHLGHAPIGDMRHILTFEPTDGGTRVGQRGEGELKGVFRWLAPVTGPIVRRMMAKNWQRTALALKQHIEDQATAPRP